MEEKLVPYSPDQIEELLTDISNIMTASIQAVVDHGTVEQQLSFKALLHHSLVSLDSLNPDLKTANEQGE